MLEEDRGDNCKIVITQGPTDNTINDFNQMIRQ